MTKQKRFTEIYPDVSSALHKHIKGLHAYYEVGFYTDVYSEAMLLIWKWCVKNDWVIVPPGIINNCAKFAYFNASKKNKKHKFKTTSDFFKGFSKKEKIKALAKYDNRMQAAFKRETIYHDFSVDELSELKKECRNVLSDREYCIFILKTLEEWSLEEIAKKFGYCRERIRQLEKKAIKKLKKYYILKKKIGIY